MYKIIIWCVWKAYGIWNKEDFVRWTFVYLRLWHLNVVFKGYDLALSNDDYLHRLCLLH